MFATFEVKSVAKLFTPHIYSTNDQAGIMSFLCALQEISKAGKAFIINSASIVLILLQILQNCLLPLPIFLPDGPTHKKENGFKNGSMYSIKIGTVLIRYPLHVLTDSNQPPPLPPKICFITIPDGQLLVKTNATVC